MTVFVGFRGGEGQAEGRCAISLHGAEESAASSSRGWFVLRGCGSVQEGGKEVKSTRGHLGSQMEVILMHGDCASGVRQREEQHIDARCE